MTRPISTTGEDFLVDGVSLFTYAYAIGTLAGRERLPPIVGENIRVPYRHGRVWKPKTYDENVITLGMWVRGFDVNNNLPARGEVAQYHSNIRALKRLFAPVGRQLSLTRYVLYNTGMEMHTALGEPASQLDFQPSAKALSTFTIDLRLADPWWYGPQIVTPGITSAGATVWNPGDVDATQLTIRFNGPLTQAMLINTSITSGYGPGGNVILILAQSVAAGHWVDVNTANFTAVDDTGASRITYIAHQGTQRWMILQPGNNVFTLSNWLGGAVGSGNVVITYSPPYT